MSSDLVVIQDYCSYGWRAEQRDMACKTDPPIFCCISPTQADSTSLGYWCRYSLGDSALRKQDILCDIWVKRNSGLLRPHSDRV